MNKSDILIRYAQYNEDLIIDALLYDVERGFYVDVGANDPSEDSVSKYFYNKGWRGINIEPIRHSYQQLLTERPEDLNINCAIGNKNKEGTFREYIDKPGHSSFVRPQPFEVRETSQYIEYAVHLKTLTDVLSRYGLHKQIHFLKIDVEGYEYEVIDGNDWTKFRPIVLCIEANHVQKDWRDVLVSNRYRLFIADGLNEYYLAEEQWHRTKDYAERAVKLDHSSLIYAQWLNWNKDFKELEKLKYKTAQQASMARKYKNTINKQEELLLNTERMSLVDKSLRRRLRLALYGITIDWWNFKKSQKYKRD